MTDLVFYKNLFGMNVTDNELEMISSPKMEVQMHAMLRFCGIGCIIGTIFGIKL